MYISETHTVAAGLPHRMMMQLVGRRCMLLVNCASSWVHECVLLDRSPTYPQYTYFFVTCTPLCIKAWIISAYPPAGGARVPTSLILSPSHPKHPFFEKVRLIRRLRDARVKYAEALHIVSSSLRLFSLSYAHTRERWIQTPEGRLYCTEYYM